MLHSARTRTRDPLDEGSPYCEPSTSQHSIDTTENKHTCHDVARDAPERERCDRRQREHDESKDPRRDVVGKSAETELGDDRGSCKVYNMSGGSN